MRVFLGLVGGLLALFVVVFSFEQVTATIYPISEGQSWEDMQALGAWLRMAPIWVSGLVVAGWFFGALAGSWVALRLSQSRVLGWLVALLDMALSIANLFLFEHPRWMYAAAVIAPLLGGWLATRIPWRMQRPV